MELSMRNILASVTLSLGVLSQTGIAADNLDGVHFLRFDNFLKREVIVEIAPSGIPGRKKCYPPLIRGSVPIKGRKKFDLNVFPASCPPKEIIVKGTDNRILQRTSVEELVAGIDIRGQALRAAIHKDSKSGKIVIKAVSGKVKSAAGEKSEAAGEL
jgi:hypothetical protein